MCWLITIAGSLHFKIISQNRRVSVSDLPSNYHGQGHCKFLVTILLYLLLLLLLIYVTNGKFNTSIRKTEIDPRTSVIWLSQNRDKKISMLKIYWKSKPTLIARVCAYPMNTSSWQIQSITKRLEFPVWPSLRNPLCKALSLSLSICLCKALSLSVSVRMAVSFSPLKSETFLPHRKHESL